MGAVLLFLLPAFVVPAFHDVFASSKILGTVVFGGAAYLALGLSYRRDGDPLAPWRRGFALGVPLLLAISALKSVGLPDHLAPFLMIAVFPLIFMEVGAGLGRDVTWRGHLILLAALSAVPVLILGVLRRYADLTFLDSVIPDRPDLPGLASTLGNSNALGEYAAPLAVLATAMGALRRDRGWLWGLPAVALVVLSDSRAALLALAVGTLVWCLIALLRRHRDPGERRSALAGVGVLLLGLVVVLAVPSLRARVTSIVDPEHPTNVVRAGLWKGTAAMVADHPLLGVGAGRFPATFPPYRDREEWRLSRYESMAEDPHDEVLWIAAEGGALGLLFLVLGLTGAILLVRRALAAEDRDLRRFATATAGAWAAFAVTALVRSPLHHPCGALLPFVLLGALAAAFPPPPRTRFTAAVCHSLVALTIVLAVIDLMEDRLTAEARWALEDGMDALSRRDMVAFTNHLRASTRAIQAVDDLGPWSPARAYRTGLVATELARLRERLTEDDMARQLRIQGFDDASTWLPSVSQAAHLFRETLQRSPDFHLAEVELAKLLDGTLPVDDPGDGSSPDAQAAAWDGVVALMERVPAIPVLREILARRELSRNRVTEALRWIDEELAFPDQSRSAVILRGLASLHRGNDVQTFGTWLAHRSTDPEVTTTGPELEAARLALAEVDLEVAREHALAHLAAHPLNAEALSIVATAGYGEGIRSDPERRAEAHRATARLKVLLANDALADQDANLLESAARLARTRDPTLLDALLIEAAAAAERGEEDLVLEAMTALRDAGVPPGVIVAQCLRSGGALRSSLDAIRHRLER